MANETPSAQDRPEDAINKFFNLILQIEDLVKLAVAAEKGEVTVSIDSFVQVHKKLTDIYKAVEKQRAEFKNALIALGMKPEDFQMNPEKMEMLGKKERKLYEKLDSLKKICEESKDRIHTSILKSAGSANQVEEQLKDPSRKKLRRKSKFRGVGGNQGWIPT